MVGVTYGTAEKSKLMAANGSGIVARTLDMQSLSGQACSGLAFTVAMM